MKLKMPVPYVQTVEVDTDDWSKETWINFIKEHVDARTIEHIIKTDLFPLERLKEKAIAAFQLAQDFKL